MVFHKNKKKTICIASFLLPFPAHRINQYGYIKQNKLKPHNTQLIETKLQKILWGISESKVLYKGKLTRNIRDQSNASHLPISARWQSACCELRRRSEGVVARTNAPLAREYWNVRSLTKESRPLESSALKALEMKTSNGLASPPLRSHATNSAAGARNALTRIRAKAGFPVLTHVHCPLPIKMNFDWNST